MSKTTAAACLFTALFSTTAFADTAVHDFTTMDRASGATGVGADLSFITGDLGDLEGFVSRVDLHGQYVHPSGFGAYGSFAVSKAFVDGSGDPLVDQLADMIGEATAITNLELGGQYRRALTSELSLVGHVGLVLPTASDDFGGFLTNALSTQRRFTDLVAIAPDVTALRVGVSPTFQRGALFARVDLGADIPVDEPEMASSEPIVHANVAIGARQGKLSGALELVTQATTGTVDENEQRYMHTGALSLQYDAGRFKPNLTVVTPLDDQGRGEIVSVGAGVAASF